MPVFSVTSDLFQSNINNHKMVKQKHKGYCTVCDDRHLPPTGKKCLKKQQQEELQTGMLDSSDDLGMDTHGSTVSTSARKQKKMSTKSGPAPITNGQNCKVKRAKAPGLGGDLYCSDVSTDEEMTGDVQVLILQQLRKVNRRLDAVEEQVAGAPGSTSAHGKDGTKLSKLKKYGSTKFSKMVVNDSSEDELELPSLSNIRSDRGLQRKIDAKLRSLEEGQNSGNESHKIKSKRGGGIDVFVKNKVAWPHEHILGGPTRQRVTYDQLNITQFVQGFVKNVLEEPSETNRERMLHYLADLMEDASDFSWANAKASHAVLLCEMERGSVSWSDTSRIDRIRRAHAQKHNPPTKNWAKNSEVGKRPWYCKSYQQGLCQHSKDHESNGKVHKHICSHCLNSGRFMSHPEKDCTFARKSQTKND